MPITNTLATPADTKADTRRLAVDFAPTLRDLARRCRVERSFGDYFRVTHDGRTYRVKATWDYDAREVTAECRCPDSIYRKRQCKHALAVVTFERSRVAGAQLGGL